MPSFDLRTDSVWSTSKSPDFGALYISRSIDTPAFSFPSLVKCYSRFRTGHSPARPLRVLREGSKEDASTPLRYIQHYRILLPIKRATNGPILHVRSSKHDGSCHRHASTIQPNSGPPALWQWQSYVRASRDIGSPERLASVSRNLRVAPLIEIDLAIEQQGRLNPDA